MVDEASLVEPGITNACRAGISHSLLIVLIVSIVLMLEVELERAFDLLVLRSFMTPGLSVTRLRFGL